MNSDKDFQEKVEEEINKRVREGTLKRTKPKRPVKRDNFCFIDSWSYDRNGRKHYNIGGMSFPGHLERSAKQIFTDPYRTDEEVERDLKNLLDTDPLKEPWNPPYLKL